MESDDPTLTVTSSRPNDAPRNLRGPEPRAHLSRYVVLDEVAEGGMGKVFRAYDPDLQREVALKLLNRRAMRDPNAKLRLVQEARAMAKLAHPNVVTVYDVEHADDDVMLVMEYVRGINLRRWLQQAHPWRDVLARFEEAGRGLVAAHEAGLLHRDFKPSNVLVPESGPVKVTDFGIAKSAFSGPSSIDSPLPNATESATFDVPHNLTAMGTILGTPRYMAPEQHDGDLLDERVDQYSFCVALWEALVGAPPFLGSNPIDLGTRKLAGPPSWPSELSIPRPIVSALRRGLMPSRKDRWPSLAALLAALHYETTPRTRWWMGGLAIAAAVGAWQVSQPRTHACTGAQSKREEFWNATAREKVGQALLRTEAINAPEVWSRTESELDAYGHRWEASYLDACETATIRGEQSSQAMDLRMSCLRRARQGFDAVVGVLMSADAATVQQVHRLVDGLPPLERCADVEILQARDPSPRPEDEAEVERMRGYHAQAKVLLTAGHYDDATRVLDAALDVRAGLDYVALDGPLMLTEAEILRERGKWGPAEQKLRELLVLATRQERWDLVQSAAQQLVVLIGSDMARPKEALRYVGLAEVLAADDPAAILAYENAVGMLRISDGDYPKAGRALADGLERATAVLDSDHPIVILARGTLALSLQLQGEYALAEQEYRTLVEIHRRTLGPGHPTVALMLNNLSITLSAQGRYDEFREAAREALELWENTVGHDHPDVGRVLNNLGYDLYRSGDYDEAETTLRRALMLWRRNLGPEHPSALQSQENLVRVLSALGQYEDAEELARDALTKRESLRGHGHTEVSFSLHTLAHVLRARGQFEQAELALRRALAIQLETLNHDDGNVAYTRIKLVDVLLEQEEFGDALPLAELAWERYGDGDDAPSLRATSAYYLARSLHGTRADPSRVFELAERALASSPGPSTLRDEIVDWQEQLGPKP